MLSSPEEIKSNSGFFSLLIIIIAFIIVFIIFCVKGKHLFEEKIDEVIYNKFDKKKKINNKEKKNNKIKGNISEQKIIKKKNTKKTFKKKKRDSTYNHGLKKSKLPIKTISNSNNINNIDLDIKNKINDIPDKENDYEMNWLSYLHAIKYDDRTCCDYYMSLIKNKQLFAFTFCSFNDYNSGIIKKFIFFLSFALHYTLNALFFTDSNMHQIFLDEGQYNFSYQFPYILISAISATIILRIMLQTLVLTDKSILEVKKQSTRNSAMDVKKKVLKCINIKYAIFFVLNTILLVLFWFYLTCLSAKYENTQIYIIENTAISFGFSLIYPFVINIIPSCLRMISLNDKEKNESCLYSTSQIMQLLLV